MASLRLIVKQVAALRAEEESEDSWFTLPYAGDEDVDWSRFEVTICGPAAPSPYAAGMFRVRVSLPDDYPRAPPAVEFLTRVWHPNIHLESGRPCVDLLREAWKPGASTLRDLLLTLRELLAAPNPADSVNPEAAREMLEDRAAFDAHAEAEVKKVRGGIWGNGSRARGLGRREARALVLRAAPAPAGRRKANDGAPYVRAPRPIIPSQYATD